MPNTRPETRDDLGCENDILAEEGLKKLKLWTPPRREAQKKVNAMEGGSAIFDFLNTPNEIWAFSISRKVYISLYDFVSFSESIGEIYDEIWMALPKDRDTTLLYLSEQLPAGSSNLRPEGPLRLWYSYVANMFSLYFIWKCI